MRGENGGGLLSRIPPNESANQMLGWLRNHPIQFEPLIAAAYQLTRLFALMLMSCLPDRQRGSYPE